MGLEKILAGLYILFRNRIWRYNFVKNQTRRHFSISAVAGVCVVILK